MVPSNIYSPLNCKTSLFLVIQNVWFIGKSIYSVKTFINVWLKYSRKPIKFVLNERFEIDSTEEYELSKASFDVVDWDAVDGLTLSNFKIVLSSQNYTVLENRE